MVKPHLRDIQYLHIKISKEHKDLINAWKEAENFYNISEFIRLKLLRGADEFFKKRSANDGA